MTTGGRASPFRTCKSPSVRPIHPMRRRPLVRLGRPLARRERPLARRKGSLAWLEGPLARRRGPLAWREGPLARRRGPLARRRGPLAWREGPLARREGPLARREGPLAWKTSVFTRTYGQRRKRPSSRIQREFGSDSASRAVFLVFDVFRWPFNAVAWVQIEQKWRLFVINWAIIAISRTQFLSEYLTRL